MAKIRIKTSYQNIVKDAKKQFKANRLKVLVDLIKELITKGISPVEGGGRFKRYSESYREQISKEYGQAEKKNRQLSPVNMTLTGDMMKSLDIKDKGDQVFIEFDDPKAYFHNDAGAGKSKTIRRLLPNRDGERFSRNVQNRFVEIVKTIIAKLVD